MAVESKPPFHPEVIRQHLRSFTLPEHLHTHQPPPGILTDKPFTTEYLFTVSATEILNELPKLSASEMRLVRQRLLELAAQNHDIQICDQAALDGALMLDRMEEDDARRQSR